ncbi:hypothetical protein FRC01_004343 [Tulasnella sp. 417]|nr:hypothetical protein FRC01_004343 [Tulasnella sp. 417]
MSTNVNTTLAVGAAVIAAGTTAYALSSRARPFYTANEIGQPVDTLSAKSSKDRKSSTTANHEFDFVIVGGGTAAMVLANRLTEQSDVNVLVIEAGKTSRGVPASRIPGAFFQLQRTERDWSYWTTPQKGCHNRELAWTRTKILGGCSSGNAMMFNLGAPQDYDEWARLQKGAEGAEGWAYKGFKKAAYLTPEVLARPNLKVVCGAQVTKIRFNDAKRAIGVEFGEKKDGPVYFVGARKEVILSAGAINTSQILLSGIGPQSELTKHSIPIVQHLPGVGQNLADHIVFNSCFPTRPGYSAGRYYTPKNFGEQLSQLGAIAQYLIKGRGPMTTNVQQCVAFVRVGDGKIGRKVDGGEGDVREDSTSGEDAPDVEVMVAPMVWRDHGHKKFDVPEAITITTSVLRPTSKGTVTLKSADPWAKPLIDPCYLATKHDVDILVRSVKLAYQFTNTEPLKSAIDQTVKHPLLDHDLGSKSKAEIEDVIRSRAETGYHPSCTARMAPLEDGGVVDARLRVYGVEGLRVVDASVQPEIVSGHTTGPTTAIAERAADLIKEDC